MAKSLLLLRLEADLPAGQLTGQRGRSTASLGAFEDGRRSQRLFVGVEEGDHELIVALRHTAQFALWSERAKVDVSRHRASVKALAKVAAGALNALAAGVSEAHSLLLDSVSKGHFVRSWWVVGSCYT